MKKNVMPLVAIGLLGTPMALILFMGQPLFTVAHEFIAYRIGDALSLLSGEGWYVRPVQGLPNALLSKCIVWVLLAFGWEPNSYDAFQIYVVIFLGLVFVAFVAVLLTAWRSPITTEQKIAVTAYVLFPWYVGGPSFSLYIAPEYFIFEHLWLSASLIVLFLPARSGLWLGIWCGLGAAIKIPLAGIGLVLLLTSRICFWRFVLGAAGCYVLINVLYGWYSAPWMLWKQATFFLYPNHSATYPDMIMALRMNPVAVIFALASLIGIIATRMWVGLLPIALYMYLIWARPHDTSLASAALGLTFLASGFLKSRYLLPMFLAAGLLTGFSPVKFWTKIGSNLDVTEAEQLSANRGVWLMNQNSWNALLLPQWIGYNGGLALRPLEETPKAFHRFFPGNWIVDVSNLQGAIQLAGSERAIYWTAPPGTAPEISARLMEAGFKVEGRPFSFLGRSWRFYKASLEPSLSLEAPVHP